VSRRRVIINADDLGWSAGVTDGILMAHRCGVLTSATLMANMPDAARAAELVAPMASLGVGVHLNACQGPPLSRAGRRLAGRDGQMSFTGTGLVLACLGRPWLVQAVLEEFAAQIQWALSAGLSPTHLDSHRHVHAFWPLWRGLVRLAREHGVPFVRWPSERLPGDGWPAALPMQARVARLLRAMCWIDGRWGRPLRAAGGTWGIAHTGAISADWLCRAAATLPEGITEIMVHPGLAEGLEGSPTRLVQSRRRELDALCDPLVARAFEDHSVERVHYGQLQSN